MPNAGHLPIRSGVPAPAPPPRSILLIRPSALGDVCRTVPLIASLRRAFPAARLDWLVHEAFVPAVARHPAVSNIIPFPRSALSGWGSPFPPPSALRRLISLARTLAEPRYDTVIDAQGLLRSGVCARLTRAPRRLGPADARELAWLFYTDRVPPPAGPNASPHTVDRMLALLAPLGIAPLRDLTLYPDPAELAAIDQHPRLAHRRFAVFAPTSRWPGKQWPADRFAALARRALDANLFDAIAIVGSAAERPQITPLLALAAADPRVVDLVGRTTVTGLLAVIARSAFVLANDSAALHMAVGLHKPLLALFGPTDPRKVGPYARDADVLQHLHPADRFDHKHAARGRAMMERITVDEAWSNLVTRASR